MFVSCLQGELLFGFVNFYDTGCLPELTNLGVQHIFTCFMNTGRIFQFGLSI